MVNGQWSIEEGRRHRRRQEGRGEISPENKYQLKKRIAVIPSLSRNSHQ